MLEMWTEMQDGLARKVVIKDVAEDWYDLTIFNKNLKYEN